MSLLPFVKKKYNLSSEEMIQNFSIIVYTIVNIGINRFVRNESVGLNYMRKFLDYFLIYKYILLISLKNSRYHHRVPLLTSQFRRNLHCGESGSDLPQA